MGYPQLSQQNFRPPQQFWGALLLQGFLRVKLSKAQGREAETLQEPTASYYASTPLFKGLCFCYTHKGRRECTLDVARGCVCVGTGAPIVPFRLPRTTPTAPESRREHPRKILEYLCKVEPRDWCTVAAQEKRRGAYVDSTMSSFI